MDHIRKTVVEQIDILWQHQASESDLNYPFIRDHALAVMQMCEQMMRQSRNYSSIGKEKSNAI
jgi:hypothetical protein